MASTHAPSANIDWTSSTRRPSATRSVPAVTGENHTSAAAGWLRSPLLRSTLAALVAFTFYAAWAAFANRMHGMEMIVMAAVTQGLYSAAVTFVMTSLVEMLYRGGGPRRWRLTRCIGVTVLLLVVSSVGVHLIVGTAELLATVLPSWVFGSAYAVAYALGLARAEATASPVVPR